MTMRVTIRGVDDGIPTRLASVVDIVDQSPDLVITVGEEPLGDCAVRGEKRPIVPAGLEADWSPTLDELPDLLESLTNRGVPIVEAQPLVVSVDGRESTAVFDTTLITSDPARISEYGVSVDGRQHAAFRADGVVVATAVGSHGYARTAGGPQLDFGTGVGIVPIAPFATIADTWVVEPPLSVSVERDDAVTVLADTTELATGRAELTVDIESGQPLSLVDCRRLVDRC